jgi:hypothetical protein
MQPPLPALLPIFDFYFSSKELPAVSAELLDKSGKLLVLLFVPKDSVVVFVEVAGCTLTALVFFGFSLVLDR